MGAVEKKRSTRKMCKTIGVTFSIILLFVIYYELKILDLLLGIFKLEMVEEKIARISFKSLMFITKEDDDALLIEKMESLGWKFKDNYGRGYLFSKNREEVLIVKKKHFRYNIYEVQGKKYFQDKI